jgi:hypothetical protein
MVSSSLHPRAPARALFSYAGATDRRVECRDRRLRQRMRWDTVPCRLDGGRRHDDQASRPSSVRCGSARAGRLGLGGWRLLLRRAGVSPASGAAGVSVRSRTVGLDRLRMGMAARALDCHRSSARRPGGSATPAGAPGASHPAGDPALDPGGTQAPGAMTLHHSAGTVVPDVAWRYPMKPLRADLPGALGTRSGAVGGRRGPRQGARRTAREVEDQRPSLPTRGPERSSVRASPCER